MVKLCALALAVQLLTGCAGLAVDWEWTGTATYTSKPKP